MSLEKVLIIKQYFDIDLADYKTNLELSPENYSVTTSNNYYEGYNLLRESLLHAEHKLRAVIIDADVVDSQLLGLLTSMRGIHEYSESNKLLPVIVIAGSVNAKERKSLSSLASECVIKTDKTNKYLWHLVKSSLERNTNYSTHSRTTTQKAVKGFFRRVQKRQPIELNQNYSK